MDEPSAFDRDVYAVVAEIPFGRVMSYSDVAAALGSRSARGVGRAMARSEGLAWWRVIRASGLPPEGHEVEALEHYKAEGTPLRWSRDGTTYRVDLAEAAWFPPPGP